MIDRDEARELWWKKYCQRQMLNQQNLYYSPDVNSAVNSTQVDWHRLYERKIDNLQRALALSVPRRMAISGGVGGVVFGFCAGYMLRMLFGG